MAIEVWHAEVRVPANRDNVRLPFMGIPAEHAARIVRGEDPDLIYRLVAVVGGHELDKAFELTNHIDRDWTTLDGVKAMPGRHRSTSVGDVMYDPETQCRWQVKNIGFEQFTIDQGV